MSIFKSMWTQTTEKAYLVGIDTPGGKKLWNINESLDELEELAKTAGVEVIGRTYQRLKQPRPSTYIGAGKVEEIKNTLSHLDECTVIFDDELNPGQQRNLETILGEQIKVIDRTALILDIFARHAYSKEGQIQVELAQYEYRLPRLTRMWTHLVRQAGGRSAGNLGGVGLRGPGETQLEADRRLIQKRITLLKKQLQEVRIHRRHSHLQRKKSGIPVVVLVGYTNAGKSSLLNALSRAQVKAEDKLFATLDPTTRRVRLPCGRIVLFTDTVGFIKKLPHNLIAAFRATLEGILEADLILHVADISHPMAASQVEISDQVLKDLVLNGQGADKASLLVWNKIDLLRSSIGPEKENHGILTVSALTGQGIPELLSCIETILNNELVNVTMEIPYTEGALLNGIYSKGRVNNKMHTETGTKIQALVPHAFLARIEKYLINVDK
ncbi:MAG: GTPase HflX [Spirochaetales bacterium]|nr:GTPase HflX [Spirochaetales bacterium]